MGVTVEKLTGIDRGGRPLRDSPYRASRGAGRSDERALPGAQGPDQAARPSREGSELQRDPRSARTWCRCCSRTPPTRAIRKLADRREVGPAEQVARHDLVVSDRADRHVGRPGHRRLDRAARGRRSLRLLLERHDRQVGHADRFAEDMEWSCDDSVRAFAWGSGVQPAQRPQDVRSRTRRPRAQEHRDRQTRRRRLSAIPGFERVQAAGAADHGRRADQDGGAAQEDRRRHCQAGARSRTSKRLRRSGRKRSTTRWSSAPRP